MDLADQVVASDVVKHEEFPGSDQGLEGFKQFFNMFRGAFPDLHIRVEDIIAEDDRAVARYTLNATHNGDFMGIPATGRRVEISGIDISRISDGKVVEHWGNSDQLGLMQQLGVIPSQ